MIEALRIHTNDEHFDTPEYSVTPLIPYLPAGAVIWECTDTYGRSGISTGLRKAGFQVEATNFDFLTCSVDGVFDVIVTNPPFSQKDQFVERCINYEKSFALLLPLTALEGIKRHKLWASIEDEFGLLVLDRRVEFTGGGVWFNTSWFTRGLFKGVRFGEIRGL